MGRKPLYITAGRGVTDPLTGAGFSVTECYDPEDSRRSPYGDCHNNSYCHAWSCTPSYLLRKVLRPWTKEQGDRKRQSGLS